MHGLLNLHKKNTPLRTILPMTSSLQQKVAKWLAELIKLIREKLTKFSIRDIFHLKDVPYKVNVVGQQLVSCDVISLLPKITVNEFIEEVSGHSLLFNFPARKCTVSFQRPEILQAQCPLTYPWEQLNERCSTNYEAGSYTADMSLIPQS